MSNKVTISLSEVKALIESGMDRKAIGAKFGLNPGQTKKLFSQPGLKGIRIRKPVEDAFVFVNDEAVEEATGNLAEATVAPASSENIDQNDFIQQDEAQAELAQSPAPAEAPLEEQSGLW